MAKRVTLILSVLFLFASFAVNGQIINTVAGGAIAGLSGDGGPGNLARLFYPTSVAIDNNGNIFISDAANRRVRKINTSGIITTVVGSGCGFGCYGYSGDGGPATNALLYYPNSVALDTFGNMFIADYGNFAIRKVNSAGIITRYAGNNLTTGLSPDGSVANTVNINFANVTADGAGNIYFGTGYQIRKVNTAGIISTYAGAGYIGFSGDGGPATAASLNGNGNVVADVAGNLYITDNNNYRVRKVNTSGIITTVAGNGAPGNFGDGGQATNANVIPFYLSVDHTGNLYISDTVNNVIRKVDLAGIISTVAGTGVSGFSGDSGPATNAKLHQPGGVAESISGSLYITDGTNNRLRKISFGNHPPRFAGGHSQLMTVCQYSAYDSLSTILSIIDSDALQYETWGTIYAPTHGTLVSAYSGISAVGTMFPAGLYYTPVSGYSGPDSFKVRITDGLQTDSTVVHVMVVLSPGVISGLNVTCVGMTTTLNDTTGTGTWSSNNTAVASIGLLSGIVTGIASGVTTVTFTPSVGCINTVVVTVNPVPLPIIGPAGVCAGGIAAISEAIPGGVWTSSNTSIAFVTGYGVVLGIIPGTDTIFYTMSPGCLAYTVMSVFPLPAFISGVTDICPGGTTTLTDGTGTGVWTSSNTSVASIGLGTGVVTGYTPGTTIITYSVTTGATCTINRILTVNSWPDPISGVPVVCQGGATTLTDSGGGTWTSSAPTIASIAAATGIVSGLLPGTSTITYTLPTGCSITRTITVNPMPSPVTGPGAVCSGASATLSSAGGGTWSSSNTTVASIGSASGTYTGILPGTALIILTLPTGCTTTTTVTVAPIPVGISGLTQVCQAGTTTLSNGIPGGTWSSDAPGIATIGSTTGIATCISAGTASITYTTSYGCTTNTPIIVYSLPTPFSVTGGGTFCDGGAGRHVGLAGSSPSANYQLIAAGIPGVTVSGITGGTLDFGLQTTGGIYTVVATNIASGCNRVMTGNATIIVNPLPAPISGPSAVCVGSSITVSEPGVGTWTSNAPLIATIGSGTGIVNGLLIGSATISYTLPTGCFVTSPISVSTTPVAITGPSSVCVGSGISLSDLVAGGSWSSSNTSVATVGSLNGIVAGVTGGIVTITYSLGSGCTKVKTVTVNSLPSGITGTSAFCTGHLSTLTSATTGGTWSSGATGIASVGALTGVVTGLSAGSATISYILSTGCYAVNIVTVYAAPSIISGSLHACTGQLTTLTDAASGGVWTILPATLATIGSTSGIVTPGALPGIAFVTYTLGGSCSTSATMTVTATPAPIAGINNLCIGSASILSDSTAGGIWSSSNLAVAGVSGTGLVTGLGANTATISYTKSGCAVKMPITVNPLPSAITGTAALCVDLTAAFTNIIPGGAWTSSATGIASVDSGTGLLTGMTAGAATITYTLPTGCRTTKGVTINAAPSPIVGISPLCIGSVVTLSDPTSGGSWILGSGAGVVSLTTSGIVTGLSLGTALISYSVGGCPAIVTVSVNSLPPAITGPGHVCSGAAITLSNPTLGGIWSSTTPSTATVGSASGVVIGGSAGSAIIRYSLGPGCIIATTVTVIALPAPVTGAFSTCSGASVTLADADSGGTWSSSAPGIALVGSGGIVTGISGGVATISYEVGTGCAATHTVTSITVPAITLVHNLCAWGDTMTVTDPVTTGIYTSSLITVTNLGGGLARVTSNAPGTASISYLLPSGCYSSTTLTVNPLPNIIYGAVPICVGGAITLTDASPGGSWSGSGVALSIGSATGIVTGLSTGSSVVRYSLSGTGCKTDTLITVTDLPIAGIVAGPADLCAGTFIVLTDSIAGGAWTSSGSIASVLGGVVNGLIAGTDSIIYSVTNMCGTTNAVKLITVNPLPIAGTISGTDSVCVGNTVTVLATDTGGVWSFTNSNASITATGVVTGLSAGLDTVIYSVNNAWCSSSTTFNVKIISLLDCGSLVVNSGHANAGNWQVWPNPASENIYISCGGAGVLTIWNMQGRKVADYLIKDGTNKLKLPAAFNDGVYLLQYDGEDGSRTDGKLLVEHAR